MNSKLAPNIPTNVIKDTNIQLIDQVVELKMNTNPNYCISIDNNNSQIVYPYDCIINTNQQFIINPVKKQITNFDNNLCLDIDTNNKMKWSPCDLSNQNQQYIFNPKTSQIKQYNKNLCINVNPNNISNGSSSLTLTQCSNNNNQKFTPNLIKNALNKYMNDLVNVWKNV
jgi:hypothetical protein